MTRKRASLFKAAARIFFVFAQAINLAACARTLDVPFAFFLGEVRAYASVFDKRVTLSVSPTVLAIIWDFVYDALFVMRMRPCERFC